MGIVCCNRWQHETANTINNPKQRLYFSVVSFHCLIESLLKSSAKRKQPHPSHAHAYPAWALVLPGVSQRNLPMKNQTNISQSNAFQKRKNESPRKGPDCPEKGPERDLPEKCLPEEKQLPEGASHLTPVRLEGLPVTFRPGYARNGQVARGRCHQELGETRDHERRRLVYRKVEARSWKNFQQWLEMLKRDR